MLARILLDVEALQLDKLLETEFAQRDSFAGILPSSPCKILASVSIPITRSMPNRLTGLGKSHLLTKTVPASTCSARSSPFTVSFVHILAVRPNSLSFINLLESALPVEGKKPGWTRKHSGIGWYSSPNASCGSKFGTE